MGYTPEQRLVIAAIARYLGKSRPSAQDGPMKPLSPAARTDAAKSSSLLRLARAVHLGRSGAVQNVRVRLRSASVDLLLKPKRRMGVYLELWAIEKEAGYFREVFGRTLSAAVE